MFFTHVVVNNYFNFEINKQKVDKTKRLLTPQKLLVPTNCLTLK